MGATAFSCACARREERDSSEGFVGYVKCRNFGKHGPNSCRHGDMRGSNERSQAAAGPAPCRIASREGRDSAGTICRGPSRHPSPSPPTAHRTKMSRSACPQSARARAATATRRASMRGREAASCRGVLRRLRQSAEQPYHRIRNGLQSPMPLASSASSARAARPRLAASLITAGLRSTRRLHVRLRALPRRGT